MRARWRVYGRVQGVGFRWFTRAAARSLQLSGYVRNLPDGTVEIEAAGPTDRLDNLHHTLTYGPPGSDVEAVETCTPGVGELEDPFAVR